MPLDAALAGLVQQLSGPHARADRSGLEILVSEHAIETLGLFLDRFRPVLESTGDGLVSLLEGCCDESLDFDTAWHLAFGRIHGAVLRSPAGGPTESGVALALRLHECGVPGSWQAHLPSPARLAFGRWVLPPMTGLRVVADRDHIAIDFQRSDGKTGVEFRRRTGRWDADPGLETLPVVVTAPHECLLWARPDLDPPELVDIAVNRAAPVPDDVAAGYADAFALLADVSGTYHAWVTDVVRAIVPWAYEPGRFPSGSGSSQLAPGMIGIGAHGHVESLAESLLHEASHQAFLAARRVGPIVDGSDSKLYPNPFLGTERPIEYIALAYHAFAAIFLFCRSAHSRYPASAYFARQETRVAAGVAVLRAALRASASLTPLGESLLQPLDEQVAG